MKVLLDTHALLWALEVSPAQAHPRGILTGNRREEGIGRGAPAMA